MVCEKGSARKREGGRGGYRIRWKDSEDLHERMEHVFGFPLEETSASGHEEGVASENDSRFVLVSGEVVADVTFCMTRSPQTLPCQAANLHTSKQKYTELQKIWSLAGNSSKYGMPSRGYTDVYNGDCGMRK